MFARLNIGSEAQEQARANARIARTVPEGRALPGAGRRDQHGGRMGSASGLSRRSAQMQ